jgi:hypothetical protein
MTFSFGSTLNRATFLVQKNDAIFDQAKQKIKRLEMPSIDLGTSRMLSERSTI